MWIKLGDSNTKYFTAIMKERSHKKQITELTTQTGLKLTKPEEIVQFYKSLMGTSVYSTTTVRQTTMRKGPTLTLMQQQYLITEVTDQEIFEALKAICDEKAPYIDGYNVFFFDRARRTYTKL